MVAGLWYSSATGCGLVGIWLSILVFNLVQFFGVLYQVLLVASLLRPTVDDLSLSLSLSPPPPPPPSLCTRTGVCTVHTPRLCVYDACAVHTDVCKFLETGCALPEEIRHSLLFFFWLIDICARSAPAPAQMYIGGPLSSPKGKRMMNKSTESRMTRERGAETDGKN
jgi:hypothetical protein